jgi:hypothetical protein
MENLKFTKRFKGKKALLIYNKTDIEKVKNVIYPILDTKTLIYSISAEDSNFFYIAFSVKNKFDGSSTKFDVVDYLQEISQLDHLDALELMLSKENIIVRGTCIKLFDTALKLKYELDKYQNNEAHNSPPASPQYLNNICDTNTPIKITPTPNKPLEPVKMDIDEAHNYIMEAFDINKISSDLCDRYGIQLLENSGGSSKLHYIMMINKSEPMSSVINFINSRREKCSYYDDEYFHYVNIEFTNRLRREYDDFKSIHVNIEKIACIKSSMSFLNKFKPVTSKLNDSLVSEYASKILSLNYNDDDMITFKKLLSISIKNAGFEYINEYGCSLMMNFILKGVTDQSKGLGNIYGVEKEMIWEGVRRKCDCIYRYGDVLSILEYKSNTTHKQDSLEYITDRGYLLYVLKYMSVYDEAALKNINKIVEWGFEFTGKNKNYEVNVRQGEILDINEENIKLCKNLKLVNAPEYIDKYVNVSKKKKIALQKVFKPKTIPQARRKERKAKSKRVKSENSEEFSS